MVKPGRWSAVPALVTRARMILTVARPLAAGALLLFVPGMAPAQLTCNGLVSISYPTGPNFSVPGDTRRVRLTLGTGTISGGTQLSIQQLRFELDCNGNFPLTSPCTDEGLFVEYEGDGFITNTCGKSFTSGHPVGSLPNSIVFTPNTPIVIPPNQAVPPGFCTLEFNVRVLQAPSTDSTPNTIEELGGFTNLDASCDNGLQAAGGTQTGDLELCQTCDDGNICTNEVCNQSTGQCDTTDVPDGTPCGDIDSNLCTIAGCEQGFLTNGDSGCSQTQQTVACPPDGNECTDDLACNPSTGACEHPNAADGTPCTDSDQNACTMGGCDQGGCVSANLPDGTTCPDTDQDPCSIPGCVQGQCVQTYQMCPPPTPQAITGKKLLLKSSKFVLLSKDPSISVAGSDPVSGADSSITFNDGSTTADLALPATLWSANGAGTAFKYKNPDAPGGPSIVKVAKVKSGLLKVVGKGAPVAVPNGPASIDVVFRLDGGTNTYCMTFSGTGDGNKLLVKDASAGTCPAAVCGNDVREDAEACDGSDDAVCPGDCLSDCTCAAQCPVSPSDPTVCQNAQSLSQCDTCCSADTDCLTQCSAAVFFSCTNFNDSCAAAANAAGCAAECCP